MNFLRFKIVSALSIFVLFSCSNPEQKEVSHKTAAEQKAETKAPQVESKEALLARAKKIHDEVITIDTHVDIDGPDYATEKIDPGIDHPDLKCDLVKMKKGGMDAVFLAVYVSQRDNFDKKTYAEIYDDAQAKFDAIHRVFKMHPDQAEWAKTPDDVERIQRTGKRAIAIGIENGYPVGDNLENLRKFYDRGARYITLSHNRHNQICDSSGPDTPKHNGLSDFGKQMVKEMNRLGIMCDASHISEKSFYDLLEVSKAPIVVSHSGCSALNAHDRNLTDDQLRALKKNGGVIQIVALGSFLKKEPAEFEEAVEKLRTETGAPTWSEYSKMSEEEREKIKHKMEEFHRRRDEMQETAGWVDITDFVNHIDHAVKVAGIDHVGIGTDFDGGAGIKGFNNHAEALNVTVELVKRGYSAPEIKKIWGGNLLRVWREVEKAAQSLRHPFYSSRF